MKLKRLIWVAAALVVAAPVSWIAYYWSDTRDLWRYVTHPDMSSVELIHSDGRHRLYLKQRWWGFTGDRTTIVISDSPRSFDVPDSTTEYSYNGLGAFYYTYAKDTLTVYTLHPSSVPQDLHTPIVVLQVTLTSDQYFDLFKTYEQKGLGKIPSPQ